MANVVPKFRLSLLARFELTGANGPIDLPSKKLACLLAYLACTAPQPQPRQRLTTLLWGSHFEAQAQQNLRQALFRLRRVLGRDALIGDGDSVALAPGLVDCDVSRLQELSHDGSLAALAAGADLYQGPLLAGVNANFAEESWTDWLRAERRRLEDLGLDTIVRHAGQALHAGDAEKALKLAHRAVALNDLREDAHRVIVQALAATGRKAEALKHYRDLATLLARQLNTEPDAATRALVGGLRAEAGLAAESIDYLLKAGRLAFARSAYREAIASFDQALGQITSLPDTASTLEQAFDIRLELPQALIQVGDVRRALERLREAELLADRLDDDRRRCRVFSFATVVHALLGEVDEALLAGKRALEIARRLGDPKLFIPAMTILQQAHFYRGEHRIVASLAKENLALLPPDANGEGFGLATPPAVYDRGRQIISLSELGRFAEAAELEAEMLVLVARSEHAYSLGWAHLAATWLHLLKGEWAEAMPALERATAAVKAGNVLPLLPYAMGLRAWSLAQLGQTDEAKVCLQEGEQSLERHAAGGMISTVGWFYTWLGRAALELGQPQSAHRLGIRALEASPQQPGFAAHALHLLGDTAAHRDQFDAELGRGHYRRSLALAERCGMRPVIAHCHLGLARLYHHERAGRQGREHLTTATAMYREMGMTYWAAQAAAVRKRQQVLVTRSKRRPREGSTPIPTADREKPSVAVLPFHNMSGDPEQDYFADGIAEDIVTALSRFHGLAVTARGSSFAFKGLGLTHRQIAEQLGVDYLLSGTVRKAANRIRVSAELISTEGDTQVWSDRYDRALVDVFDLQDDIGRTVAAVVEPAVRSAEIERAHRKPPTNLSAYDLYLQALPHLWAGTRVGTEKAIELLRASLDHDPARTPALAAMALALTMAAPHGVDASPEVMVEAVGLARRAVEQDGTDAFAQAVYGFTLFGPTGKNDQGRIHAREATRLNPSSAFAWGVLGMIDSMGGDYENAIECLERAMVLSPYDTMLHLWTTGLAAACFALGRYEAGVAWARRSIQHSPGNGTGHRMLAANLAAAGHVEEAREITSNRDTMQKTTISELRAMRYFKRDDVLERYLAAQRMIGVAE